VPSSEPATPPDLNAGGLWQQLRLPDVQSYGRLLRIVIYSLAALWMMLGLLAWTLYTGADVGTRAALVGLFAAFVPLPLYISLILWIDRFEPEPHSALIAAFAWGAIVATAISLVLNGIGGLILQGLLGGVGAPLTAPLVAPVVEELSKGAALVGLYLWKRDEFNGVIDGIVYASIVGLGFAAVENILYYSRTLVDASGGGLPALFLLRGVLAPFAHPLFTSMFGIGIGLRLQSTNPNTRRFSPWIGLGAAIFLHSLWNSVAIADGRMFALFYVIVWLPLFLGFLVVIALSLRREAEISGELLRGELADGTLSASEHRELCTLSARLASEWQALRAGGIRGRRARRAFHRTASELTLLRRRVACGHTTSNDTQRERAWIDDLRATIEAIRANR